MPNDSYRDYDGLVLGTTRGAPGAGEDSAFDYAAGSDIDFDDHVEDELYEPRQFDDNRSHRGHAVSSLNSLDGVGRFVLPHAQYDEIKGRKRISYCDHLDIVRDRKHKIDFNPLKYQIFDGAISEELARSRRHNAIENPNNQYYEAYGPLRQNLAVLRNALYANYFPDGEYNPEDPKDREKRAKIHDIARKIGNELKWQSRFQRIYNLVTFNFSERDFCIKRFGKYGQEHFGAQKLYEKLYKEQEKLSLNPIHWMMGRATRHDWGLPHPEESPFCQKDMREATYNDHRDEEMGVSDCAPTLCSAAMDVQGIAAKLKTGAMTAGVAQMSFDQREESIALGREILEKLRKMCAGRSQRMREGIDHQSLDLERAHLLNGLAENYLQMYQDLLTRDPSIAKDSTFERARIALGKLGHLTMLNGLSSSSAEQKREYETAYAQLPEEYKKVAGDNEADLIRDVEVAMDELCHRQNMSKHAAPELQQFAKSAVQNLHNTMSGARIGAASANIIDKAKQVSAMNQGHEAKVVQMNQDQNLGTQYRA